MLKGSGNRDAATKAGLSVRYCFTNEQEDCKPGRESAQDNEEISKPVNKEPEVPYNAPKVAANSTPTQRPSHQQPLPRPNNMFHPGPGADFKRRALLGSARLRQRSYFLQDHGLDSSYYNAGNVWRAENKKDPGIFVTTAVQQPPKDDVISWDSSCSESSSDEDIRDTFGLRNRSARRAAGRGNVNYSWANAHHPVPPAVRNVTANKAEDAQHARGSIIMGGQGHSKKVENTYRLDPKPGHTFVWFKAKRPIVNIVDQLLNEFVYNARSGPAVTRRLCEVILKMIKKSFDWPRYRFVCHVVLAELKHQGIMVADRALWSTAVDNVASYVHKNRSVVCVVTFHAFYLE